MLFDLIKNSLDLQDCHNDLVKKRINAILKKTTANNKLQKVKKTTKGLSGN